MPRLENDNKNLPVEAIRKHFGLTNEEAKYYIRQEKQTIEVDVGNGSTMKCKRWELIWPSEAAMKEYYNFLIKEE